MTDDYGERSKRLILDLRAKIAIWRAEMTVKRFDPNQPRVPAGRPDGGQWTDDTRTAMGRRLSAAECDDLFDKDNFHCKMVGLRSCYQQATFRYGDCLAGRTIRPLSY
ncbi:hypothetical protein [Devosia sp. XK-2]|uniref:hypothetical protein n=1 Tax=Devosia sp. XK-2 TaxID=3126689 RepID=UPI0030CC5B29